MYKRNQAKETQVKSKSNQKVEPSQNNVINTFTRIMASKKFEEADQLKILRHMNIAQRQAVALHLSHMQGNQYLQRLLQPLTTSLIQRTLIDYFGEFEQKEYTTLITQIAKAPPQERHEVLTKMRNAISDSSKFSKEERMGIMAALLEGSLNWKVPSVSKKYETDFIKFLEGKDEVISPNTTLLCWESIFYEAYLAKLLDRQKIVTWLQKNHKWREQNNDTLWKSLGYSPNLPQYTGKDDKEPEVGQLVFYAPSLTAWTALHVVLSVGGGYAMSLAGENTQVQRIKIEEYDPKLIIRIGPKFADLL